MLETATARWSVEADEGEARWFFRNLAVVKVAQADARGLFSLIEFSGAPGDMPPLHRHVQDDEIFYILDGRATFYAGNDVTDAGRGDTVFAPRGVAHTYRVTSADGARWLVLTSPGDFEPFVVAASVPAERRTLPPPSEPPTHHEVEQMTALAAEHGIEILGPPGTLPRDV